MFHQTLLIATLLLPAANALWPIPRTLVNGTTLLKLSSNFNIHVNVARAPQDLVNAVTRTQGYLRNDKLGRLVVGRGSSDSSGFTTAESLSSLTISLAEGSGPALPIATEAIKPIGTRDESYSLTVPADGSGAVLVANSTLGLFRGLSTFDQLWYEFGGVVYTTIAPINIENDAPAYVGVLNSCRFH